MPRSLNRCSCYRKSMLLRAWIAACAAALAVSSAPESRAAPPQDLAAAPAAKSGCFVAGDGYLRARLRGALELDLDWKDAQMECEGGPRPSGNGVRVSIGGPAFAFLSLIHISEPTRLL